MSEITFIGAFKIHTSISGFPHLVKSYKPHTAHLRQLSMLADDLTKLGFR